MPIVINGTGTVSGISVGGLPDGIVDTDMLATGAATGIKQGAGSIIQCLSVVQAGVDSSTSTSWADTANMTLNITPQTDSKVLILFSGCVGHTDNTGMKFRIARVKGGTTTYHAAASSSEMTMISYTGSSDPTNQIYHQNFHHMDAAPGGDGSTAITYKLQWKIDSGTIYLGRDDTGSVAQYAGGNSWTLMEIRG